MGRQERLEIIRNIEEIRGAKLICYLTSDRIDAKIASDVVSKNI